MPPAAPQNRNAERRPRDLASPLLCAPEAVPWCDRWERLPSPQGGLYRPSVGSDAPDRGEPATGNCTPRRRRKLDRPRSAPAPKPDHCLVPRDPPQHHRDDEADQGQDRGEIHSSADCRAGPGSPHSARPSMYLCLQRPSSHGGSAPHISPRGPWWQLSPVAEITCRCRRELST